MARTKYRYSGPRLGHSRNRNSSCGWLCRFAIAIEFGSDLYVPALKDWLVKGAESEYVWTPEEVAAHIIPRTDDAEKAEPTFKLGVYFQQQGDEERANKYWEESQRLNPDSWNFHRQDWSFTPKQATGNWLKKVQTLGDKPYYQPMDLPGEETQGDE